jgi:hypothetical protein
MADSKSQSRLPKACRVLLVESGKRGRSLPIISDNLGCLGDVARDDLSQVAQFTSDLEVAS